MTRKVLGILAAIGMALPLFADSGNKKVFEVTSTQTVPFQPGGTIRLNHSYGYLSIEGWDRPEVEITVIKSLDNLYDAKEQGEATKRVNTVQVTAERKSDTDLQINTAVPHYSRWTHPLGSTGGVMVEYQIKAPRNSNLAIQQGTGDIMVTGINADINATGSKGDIVVLLPEGVQYSIDAKTKLGTVSSDFDGDFHHRHWVGIRYATAPATPAHKIYLRMGIGGITLKGSPAMAQPPSGAVQ